ncbi:MAG TPA: hypothetical protein ENK39_06360 [Epsilonproteobacteria bacterium]|nr:hypothetical protein [Campylobacterota bacterium]
MTKQTLPELLASAADKKFLFLGREGLFTQDEIVRFLKKYDITTTKYLEEDVVAIIEPLSLNPVEEDISNDAYDAKVPSFSLDAFEKFLSESINDDELLMAIKLTNDQDRVFRLLGNENISEELFVKLLMMYEWHDDEEDNREDRDTIMYTLKRYIDIKPNEADLHYSYLTLRRLATEATNPKLLLALIGFQNFEFLIRGKEKVTLRETIARNAYLDKEVITKLVSLRDKRVDVALAGNATVETALLQTLLEKENEQINEALATNANIDNEIFKTLLTKEDKVVQLLLLSQKIDLERLAFIDAQALDEALFSTIGANEHLDAEVIDALKQRKYETLLCNLAQNRTLSTEQLEAIYEKGMNATLACLAMNAAMPVALLEKFYNTYEEKEVQLALAHNPRTPEPILRALFEKDDLEIQRNMASNSSIPLDILDILKVDTRLQNELAKNPILIKGYETVLDYDKKAVQF